MLTILKKLFVSNSLNKKESLTTKSSPPQSELPLATLTASELKKLGDAHVNEENLEKAESLYLQAIATEPGLAKAHNMLGFIFKEQNKFAKAKQSLQRAIDLDETLADAHFMLASIRAKEGNLELSVTGFTLALELDPELAFAYQELCLAYVRLGRLEQAHKVLVAGIKIFPDMPYLHFYQGNLYLEQGQYQQAVSCYQRTIFLQGDLQEAHYNAGIALQGLNRCREAIEYYLIAQQFSDNFASGHFNESICHLLLGDLIRGWEKFESRWELEPLVHSRFTFLQEKWNGEQDLHGKTLLLLAEQGYGDTIQFARYAKLAAARGATVLLMVHAPLESLMQNIEGVENVFVNGMRLPHFDYYCPLLSLPGAFETQISTIPSQMSYLQSNPLLLTKWKSRLPPRSHRRWIGIAWSGNPDHVNDKNRSIALADICSVFNVDADFVVLQKELTVTDQLLLEKYSNVLYLDHEIGDFSDTAAIVDLLDLVISVDTSIAHLAGALGKPIQLLLAFVPDWRWLLERDNSPWYPSMSLIRQPERGDWSSVIHELTNKINDKVTRS